MVRTWVLQVPKVYITTAPLRWLKRICFLNGEFLGSRLSACMCDCNPPCSLSESCNTSHACWLLLNVENWDVCVADRRETLDIYYSEYSEAPRKRLADKSCILIILSYKVLATHVYFRKLFLETVVGFNTGFPSYCCFAWF